jgi:hypothetical protein
MMQDIILSSETAYALALFACLVPFIQAMIERAL